MGALVVVFVCLHDRYTAYAAGWTIRGLNPDGGSRFYCTSKRLDRLWAHPVSYSMDTGDFSLGEKRRGRESDHLPLFSAEVKNDWSYISTPLVCLRGVYRDNLMDLRQLACLNPLKLSGYYMYHNV